jgi:acyl carrier protein
MLEAQYEGTRTDEPAGTPDTEQRAAEIQAWLVIELARLVKCKPAEIDPRQPFVRYGLGSAQGLELAAKLEDWVGFRLPPTLVWDYPTIEAVSRQLAEDPEGVAAAAEYQEDE